MMDMGPIGRAEWSQLPLAKEETNWTGANDRNGEQNREDAGKMKQESGKEERKKRERERDIEEIRREKLKRKQNQKG